MTYYGGKVLQSSRLLPHTSTCYFTFRMLPHLEINLPSIINFINVSEFVLVISFIFVLGVAVLIAKEIILKGDGKDI